MSTCSGPGSGIAESWISTLGPLDTIASFMIVFGFGYFGGRLEDGIWSGICVKRQVLVYFSCARELASFEVSIYAITQCA